MRRSFPPSNLLSKLVLLATSCFAAQITLAQPPPQTARQALIEMIFGEAPGHFEKHLPDITREVLGRLGSDKDESIPQIFGRLSKQAKAEGAKSETFDAGPTLFKANGHRKGDELEIRVVRDDLVGGEDQIELVFRVTSNGKERTAITQILRFTFSMRMESDVWRLNEVDATARFPIADPAFLKALEQQQAQMNEQLSLFSMRSVVSAEKSYQAAQDSYACKLSALGGSGKDAAHRAYLYDPQLADGKKNGYVFSISECSPSHYRLSAEPESQDQGQRAYCSDETGAVRSSSDGRAATCFSSGEAVESDVLSTAPTSNAVPSVGSLPVQRIRVSQGVAAGLILDKVQPVYPPEARSERISGKVVLQVLINPTGDVVNVELVSGHPLLAPAAIDAVKRWKYRPYLLNGKPVSVDTQVQVNFTLLEN